ncbi:MAG: CPBP family intramembrane metalloprotease [Acidimicrobiia bacterium]|nr:CPBP family intramembrane metalloprotease [Acidimicrobiia bacterium]
MYSPPAPLPAPAPPGRPATPKNPIPRTVVTAILLGVVLQVVTYGLVRGLHLPPATGVVLGLGLTVAFYLAVLWLVQGRLFYGEVRPVWHVGAPGAGAAVGVGVGAGVALAVVTLNSAIAGHLASDATATTVFAQGGLLRIGMLVLLTVVAAPLIEELLFRGLLAESLRGRGRGAAIWLSALAFALWHLRPDMLRYYLLMGALLGLLYWKRGLVCSMSAHATFNGLLAVVAALSLTGPPHAVTAAGVSISAPAGWSQVNASSGSDIELQSPSGAEVLVHRLSSSTPTDPAILASRMNALPRLAPGVTIKAGTVRAAQYPAGQGAAAEVNDSGHDGEVVVLSSLQGAVIVELITGGNANAPAQFDAMLQSLQIG